MELSTHSQSGIAAPCQSEIAAPLNHYCWLEKNGQYRVDAAPFVSRKYQRKPLVLLNPLQSSTAVSNHKVGVGKVRKTGINEAIPPVYFLLSSTPIDTKEGLNPKKLKRTKNRKLKRIIYGDTFVHNGTIYNVNAGSYGLYKDILRRMLEQFEIARLRWSKVFVLRFDLHLNIATKDNKLISRFRNRLFPRLKRAYGFSEIGFLWVREREKAKAQHYHWLLLLDGRLIQHSSRINKIIKECWGELGHVPTIKSPFYNVCDDDTAKKAVYRASYLSKIRGKGYRAAQTKDYQCSRMKLTNNRK